VPADRPPSGPGRRPLRRRTDLADERRGRLERLWGLVLRRFRDHAENPDEEHDDQP
jgi:hypothetical protein